MFPPKKGGEGFWGSNCRLPVALRLAPSQVANLLAYNRLSRVLAWSLNYETFILCPDYAGQRYPLQTFQSVQIIVSALNL